MKAIKTSLNAYIIKRYLRFDKTQPFISIAALLAFFGVAIGVMVLIIAMAIMNGFDKEFERKLFIMNYPITVYAKSMDRIDDSLLLELEEKFPHLRFSPYLSTQVIVKRGNQMEGGLVFGVDFEREKKVNTILAETLKDQIPGKYHAVIGRELSKALVMQPGEKPVFIFTALEPGGFSVMPTLKRFTVDSVFKSGLSAYDKSYIFTSVESLQKILRVRNNAYDGIRIYSEKPFEDIKEIKAALPLYAGAVGWWEQNGNFFAALQMEKRAMFIVLMLIILIASLNIISSLLMTVMSRRREIALMLSLGASKKEVKNIFFNLGMIIGTGGIILGILLGLGGVWILGSFDIVSLPADVYPSSQLPMELSWIDFAMIVGGSFGIVMLSSLYPSKKAADIDVLGVLRNE